MTGDIHAGPLDRAAPTDEHHAGPLPASAHPEKTKKSERERRWERRRRRRAFEEVLGWILVPIICVSVYWAIKGGLAAVGTSPTALIQGVKAALSSSGRI